MRLARNGLFLRSHESSRSGLALKGWFVDSGFMACSWRSPLSLWFVGLCAAGFCSFACESEEGKEPARPAIAGAPEKAQLPKSKDTQPPRPKADTVRLVVVGALEPLASEKAQLLELTAALKKARLTLSVDAPSAVERRAAVDLASQKPTNVPGWAEFETVVVLEIVEPEGTEKGSRLSRGRGNLFILHPPEKEPTFSTVYETEDQGVWLDGGKLGAWLATHVRFRKGEKTEEPPPEKQDQVLVKKGAD